MVFSPQKREYRRKREEAVQEQKQATPRPQAVHTKPGTPPKHLRLTTPEAAEYLGTKPRTLKKWRHERRIPYYRLGHVAVVFDVRDLDAFLARHRVEAI